MQKRLEQLRNTNLLQIRFEDFVYDNKNMIDI